MIEGDQVAIRWRFTFAFKDGGKLQQDEVAGRIWRDEKIATETFFYDLAQRGSLGLNVSTSRRSHNRGD